MVSEATLEIFFSWWSPTRDSRLRMPGAWEAVNPLQDSRCVALVILIDKAKIIFFHIS